MANINEDKLNDLRDYFLNGGSTENEDVMQHLSTTKQSVVDAYVAALKARFPDDFGGSASEPDDEDQSFLLRDENGLMKELEIVRNKKGVVVFQVKEPKDLVTIIVKGKPVEVDLFRLRKLPETATEHGLPVSRLIELAVIAKG